VGGWEEGGERMDGVTGVRDASKESPRGRGGKGDAEVEEEGAERGWGEVKDAGRREGGRRRKGSGREGGDDD